MAHVFISHSSRDAEPAARIKAWLQDQKFETPFLDFDKHAGIAPGANWEKTLYREIERSEAVIVVLTENWLDSKWCFAEYTQARALGKPIFPLIETPLADASIAPDIQSLNLLNDREGALEQLVRELTRIALDAQGGFSWDTTRPPYPGLMAFQSEDAAIYFGRDDDIRRLMERLNARRTQGGTKLIALLGASGSGKSSLLRAGVIPRINRDPRNWIVLPPMRPQAHPIDELARTFAIALNNGAEWRSWRDRLRGGDLTSVLGDLANDLKVRFAANEAQILISIDQAEELFGTAVPEEADSFLTILNAAMSEQLPYLCILTLRSDYLEQLQLRARQIARFEQFSLGTLPLSRYAQIIEGPARIGGIRIEEGLVQQASRDAETEDALPLLAFALRELYDQSSHHDNLTLADYYRLGDPTEKLTALESAVRKAADAVLAQACLSDDQLIALRDAFVPALVLVNEKGEFARRPARWDELPAKSHPILESLAKARLVILRQDGDTRVVEVAHEALLRKWPRLRAWLEEAREFLIGRQQLERDMIDWERASESDKTGALLSGLKLNRARTWLSDRGPQLSAREHGFILASMNRADAEAREKEERQKREIKRQRLIAVSATAAGLIMAGIAIFAGIQWRNSKANLEVAKANELAATAQIDQNHLLFFPRRSLLLATESLKRFASLEADQTVRKALALTPRPKTSVHLDADPEFIAFSGDGQTFAMWLKDGRSVQVGDVLTGKVAANIPAAESTTSIALSPDGSRIALVIVGASPSPSIEMWNTRPPIAKIFSIRSKPAISHAVFSRDGKQLHLSGDQGVPIESLVVDARDNSYLTARAISVVQTEADAFSPDGKHVIERGGGTYLVQVMGHRVISAIPTYFGLGQIAFGPDESFSATERSNVHIQSIYRAWRLIKDEDLSLDELPTLIEIARMARVSGELALSHMTVTLDGKTLLALERGVQGSALRSWDLVGAEVPVSEREASDLARQKASGHADLPEELKLLEDLLARQWPAGISRPSRLASDAQIGRFALTDDKRNLATIDLENLGIIHVWDVTVGREIAQISDASDLIDNKLYFAGKYLISEGTLRKTTHYWLWRHQDMVDEACLRLTRNLSKNEWSKYMGSEPPQLTCPKLPVPSVVEEENSQASVSPKLKVPLTAVDLAPEFRP